MHLQWIHQLIAIKSLTKKQQKPSSLCKPSLNQSPPPSPSIASGSSKETKFPIKKPFPIHLFVPDPLCREPETSSSGDGGNGSISTFSLPSFNENNDEGVIAWLRTSYWSVTSLYLNLVCFFLVEGDGKGCGRMWHSIIDNAAAHGTTRSKGPPLCMATEESDTLPRDSRLYSYLSFPVVSCSEQR